MAEFDWPESAEDIAELIQDAERLRAESMTTRRRRQNNRLTLTQHGRICLGMTDTNLTQRNSADWLDSTATLARQANRQALLARLNNHPEAAKLEQRAHELSIRVAAGEALTPRF